MLNKIFLQGRLCKNPELGTPRTAPPWRPSPGRGPGLQDKETGEKKADFINVVAWRSTAEFVSRYFTKGRMAVGRPSPDPDYTDRNGNKRTAAEVVADNVYFGDSSGTPMAAAMPRLNSLETDSLSLRTMTAISL